MKLKFHYPGKILATQDDLSGGFHTLHKTLAGM